MTSAAPAHALGTFRAAGRSFPGLVVGPGVLDLTGPVARAVLDPLGSPRTTRDLLERWDDARPLLAALADQVAQADRPDQDGGKARPIADLHPLDRLRVDAPVESRQILQAGANYRTHVIDLAVKHAELRPGQTPEQVRAEVAAMMDERAVSGRPYIFVGLPSAVTGPYDEVVLPGYSEQHDWELELAAVIGRPAFRVPREQALDHVAGYTIVNDLTTRDLVFAAQPRELGTDWFRSKNAPGFLPTGPFLVPADQVPDPRSLQIRLALNGEVMQDESTQDMIFDVAAVVSEASRTARLLPGDLVLTGSPAGNGLHWGRLLRPGDLMEGSITGLGTQRTRCVAEGNAR